MTREILYRGKTIDDGKWAYGGYAYCVKDNTHYITLMGLDHISHIRFHTQVDPATIGQYIGQTDKNGKKIFEGDRVTFTRYNALGYKTARTGEVIYYDKLPIFYVLADTGDAWDWCDLEEIEVIGNVYDCGEEEDDND